MLTLTPIAMAWTALAGAVVCEVAATILLHQSNGFTRIVWGVAGISLYVGACLCFSKALRHIPLGEAYALWCGLSIILITLISIAIYKHGISPTAWTGVVFILLGVILTAIGGGLNE